ncbi:MAG: outer membrane protein assembly factor BamE [Pseudomonadota bacterium]
MASRLALRPSSDIGREARAARDKTKTGNNGTMIGNPAHERTLATNRLAKAVMLGCAVMALGACSSIRESRGFVNDPVLVSTVQPGIDNRRSVEGALGRPTFESQYGENTWYYISSVTGRRPFVRPRIRNHFVMAIKFDEEGNVASVDRSGIDQVVYLQPDGDKTPTLGRERGFLEDLFGNIGQVGSGPVGGAGPGGP